jgi:hypothetical protein
MRPATPNSFDVAIWLLERARSEDTYLQPRKLQCLLFLAQAHFAAAYKGRVLMPSFFIMDDAGPIDPNLYRALENGRPEVSEKPLDEEIVVFLDAVWRRYREADALRSAKPGQVIAVPTGLDDDDPQREAKLALLKNIFDDNKKIRAAVKRNKVPSIQIPDAAPAC